MMNEPPVYLSREQIQRRVRELGQTITRDLRGKEIVCIAILKGSVIFLADLIREIHLPLSVDFLGASSYGTGTSSSGVVKLTMDLSRSIEGKDVLIVEDIVDTGLTLDYLLENLRTRNPASIRLCTLLLKPARLKKSVPIDYLGFTIDDRFVVGYGLDHGEFYRNLPYLGYLDETPK